MEKEVGLHRRRPRLFIGSSVEKLPVAYALQARLQYFYDSTIWDQGIFGLTRSALDSLLAQLAKSDFAAVILDADDTATVRDSNRNVPRDNVVFELGLFMGRLGTERTFMVYDRKRPPDLPTDLAGITPATYQLHEDGNIDAALGPVAHSIKQSISRVFEDSMPASETNASLMNRDDLNVQIGGLEQRIINANTEICISGNDCKMAVEVASTYIGNALERNVKVKILCVNPDNDALAEMLGMVDPRFDHADDFRNSMKSVESRLRTFRDKYPTNFEFRYMNVLPAIGLFISDPDSGGVLKVETYTPKPSTINFRPHMVVPVDSYWRPYYLECWKNYWGAAIIPE